MQLIKMDHDPPDQERTCDAERKNIQPGLVVSVVSGLARPDDNNNNKNSAPDVVPEDSDVAAITLPLPQKHSVSSASLLSHHLSHSSRSLSAQQS